MKTEMERTGWGRALKSRSLVIDSVDICEYLHFLPAHGVIPVGLSRSYGDSALNSSGLCVTSQNQQAIRIDKSTGVANCESGATIGQLERAALENGYFPFVVPGTEFVTIGGAIASDVHGKSHHLHGSFGNYVIEINLMLSNGVELTLSPDGKHADFFNATVGGMGLTGLIKSAKIQLRQVESVFISTENIRVPNLKCMLNTLRDFEGKYEYCVAWVDLSGKFEGRGIVSGGNHAKVSELPSSHAGDSFVKQLPRNVNLPNLMGFRFINAITIRLFNNLWYHKSLKSGLAHIQAFMHPLDGVANWNRLYGRSGFHQYQFVVPFDQEDFLLRVLDQLKSTGISSPLAVLKGFGNKSEGLLSFPKCGWTLSVDISSRNKFSFQLLDALDVELVKLGGRVYLTKDSRMDSSLISQMYPNIDRWRKIRNEMDPNNVWQSDQSRRLAIC